MANENLRAALGQADMSPDELARIVQVDVRTVRRWLSGGTPYPRQRGKVARALDTTEHDLWPEIGTTPPPSSPAARASDILDGYASANEPAAPDSTALMRDATDRIELLGDTLVETLSIPGVTDLLAAKAAHGCVVRILVYDTGPELAPLFDRAGVEIRLLDAPADYVIHRYDDELLLILHVIAVDADHAPLLHLRRTADGGLFDRLAAYYDELWQRDSHPLEDAREPALEEGRGEGEDDWERSGGSLPPAGGHAGARGSARSSSPPRRWPRRP